MEKAKKTVAKKRLRLAKESDKTSLVAEVALHKGKYCAILCARYVYRGKIERVGEDVIVLQPSSCVEVTGPCNGKMPILEDPFDDAPAIISTGAIELVFFPDWATSQFKRTPPDEKKKKRWDMETNGEE